jgi:hypothetical protein
MSNQKHYSSKKFKQKKKKRRIIKYSVISALFILFFFATSYISHNKNLIVTSIKISDNNYLDEDSAMTKIEKVLYHG